MLMRKYWSSCLSNSMWGCILYSCSVYISVEDLVVEKLKLKIATTVCMYTACTRSTTLSQRPGSLADQEDWVLVILGVFLCIWFCVFAHMHVYHNMNTIIIFQPIDYGYSHSIANFSFTKMCWPSLGVDTMNVIIIFSWLGGSTKLNEVNRGVFNLHDIVHFIHVHT